MVDPAVPDPNPDPNGDPAPTPDPEKVEVDKGEWNKLQARLRKLEKASKKEPAPQPDPDPNADPDPDPDPDPAPRKRKAEADPVQRKLDGMDRKLRRRLLKVAVQEDLVARGLPPSDTDAMLKLMDRSAVEFDEDGDVDMDSLREAVEGTLETYGKMFRPADEGSRRKRVPGPASPAEDKTGKPAGYVTPEEYLKTPIAVRYTKAFRERVELSRPLWPAKISAKTFGIGGE